MKSALKSSSFIVGALLAFGVGITLAPQPGVAANANAPYSNINPSNDRGNDTGDSQIEGLNASQLNQNYWRNAQQPGGVPNPPTYQTQAAPVYQVRPAYQTQIVPVPAPR